MMNSPILRLTKYGRAGTVFATGQQRRFEEWLRAAFKPAHMGTAVPTNIGPIDCREPTSSWSIR